MYPQIACIIQLFKTIIMKVQNTTTPVNKVTKVKKAAAKKVVAIKEVKKEVVKVKKSLEERQIELLSNANKTAFDFIKLANVTDKIENKSISKVFANVTSSSYISDILGSNTLPSFKDFAAKMPVKSAYSNWDGYKCLLTFNTAYQLAKKVKKQNKKVAAI